MKSVGIDIGSFSIKVAEIEATGKSYTILRFDEFLLNQDASKDNQIDIIDFLRTLSEKYDVNTTRFVFGIDQKHITCRRLLFPFNDKYKINKTLPFELEDEIPLRVEDSVFDAKISRLIGPSADILSVACPGERVASIIETAKDGLIDPDIVSPKGVALANLFEEWRESPLQIEAPAEDSPAQPGPFAAQIFLDLGHETTNIIVIKDGYLLEVRSILWGGVDIAHAISKKYHIHHLEALKELRNKGFVLNTNEGATKDQIAFSDTIKGEIDRLGHRLKLVLMEVQAAHQLEYQSISILGGVCQVKNMGLYLTQILEVPANRLSTIPLHPHLDLLESPKNEVVSMTALGLALEGIKKRKNPPINLRQQQFSKQDNAFIKVYQKWGNAIKIGAAAFVFLCVYGVIKDSIATDLNDQSYELMKTQGKKITGEKRTNAKKIKDFVKAKNRTLKNAALAEKLEDINSTLDILNKISQLTPKSPTVTLDLSKLSIKNELVKIEGTAADGVQIKKLSQSLRSMAKGKIKSSSSIISPNSSKKRFSLEFKVQRRGKSL